MGASENKKEEEEHEGEGEEEEGGEEEERGEEEGEEKANVIKYRLGNVRKGYRRVLYNLLESTEILKSV